MTKNTKILLAISAILLIILSFYVGRKSASYEIVQKTEQNNSIQNSAHNSTDYKPTSHSTTNSNTSEPTATNIETGNVPNYALETLQYIRANNKAPEGYVGGRTFQNREQLLPKKDENGNSISYQEWDVHLKIEGKNRGAERLVTSEREAYFTENHYKSFRKIQE